MKISISRNLQAGAMLLCALSANAVGQTPDEWVNSHNKFRRSLTGYDGKPASSPDLVWSDALAKDAKEWADKLAASGKLDHRPNSSTHPNNPDSRPFGENLAQGLSGTTSVDTWVNSEKAFFHAQTSTCRGGVCGHYTQVISQLSKEVGCANGTSSDGTVYSVCNYNPHGNLTRGEAYSELYRNQRAPAPGGEIFEELNRSVQLDLRFNQCLLTLANTIAAGSNPQGATDRPAACEYTKIRVYDSGSDSGLTGYTGTADSAAGYLIGMLFKGKVLGLFGGVTAGLNPLRSVLVTGE